jgi:hypothetical protein
MARTRFNYFAAFVLLLSASVLGVAAGGPVVAEVYAASPPGQPSDSDRVWMDRLLRRLLSNSEGMPIPVTNTLNSLDRTLDWTFDCPTGAKLKRVQVLVSTEHVAWDPHLAGSHGSAGTYYWGVRMFSLGGVATITADNWLMLDPKSLEYEAKKGAGGTVVNEGLLYHELLHGELMILAMNSPRWKRKACNLELDLRRNDQDHEHIDPAVDIYLENRARLLPQGAAG